ncbi:methyltransferase domain-containing protein [Heyndrickxia sporothermodurans]|uniref:Small RNA 2'-O-methyltransferase n=1 Tax=Heyndrickxia sporothermodurans TaxID=46224 RepID=A0A150L5Q0_9BACI|nr:methyltransferase domain-containing protein [Heyndrickxia sporothermodurans]KYD07631.1 hypothetical protein B4102_2928 [Heyndrickxia sporothermodurans]MBL5766232.1 methyltransferase domain-containing protein [Heyndrickxia sporothermodurans]MBL5769672.1 methyltransferase domain-containing protein [Heyndrickxia sporothermodurans]MBL5773568.1 methyltransferase domain-containing protein [Heyndrickxia sporothermodurans]MBL5776825.1 methyltransferase domain-containing protein [Heyndrickxia sporot
MQLSIRATGENVHVISYLLAKNPNNSYERKVKGHLVRLFFSKCSDLEVDFTIFVTPDPIELKKNHANASDITHYINDREFAVSSIFLSLIRTALGTALNGQPIDEYREWVDYPFPFEFNFGPVSSSLSDQEIASLFEPLGYEMFISRDEIDYSFHLKEKSTACFITLKGNTTLQTGLRQLFVLIPVLDNYKHYYIDQKEVEKVERYGSGWLEEHPLKEFILKQALRFKEIYSPMKIEGEIQDSPNNNVRLNDQRYERIIETVKAAKYKESIVDFGSGEGKLSVRLGFVDGVKEILAVEPSESATIKAIRRFERVESKIDFVTPTTIWGSLFYYDARLKHKDIIILCEVIEHIDESRLPKVMQTIFREYQPKTLIITTPNQEYNNVYDLGNQMRHDDHRFEWTRTEFKKWCTECAEEYPYDLKFEGIGEENERYGFPTQICVFTRKES